MRFWRARAGDVAAAFGLLTRLPVPQPQVWPGAGAAWAWPLAGSAVGALGAAAGLGAQAAGLAPGLAATVGLAAMALATGALHEDGLADAADGLGGATVERRLAIMQDSRIGSYGVMALVLAVLLRWQALALLLPLPGGAAALVAAAALGRAPMAALMAWLPPARPGGLSAATGRPPMPAVAGAAVLALGLGAALTGVAGLPAVLAAAGAALAVGLAARARLGGQTGDVLGAAAILSETAALMAYAVALASA